MQLPAGALAVICAQPGEVQEKAGAAGWPSGQVVLHSSPIVMPLKEWIEHPLVKEVIHDGETLQV